MAARQPKWQRRTGWTGSRSVELLEERRLLSAGDLEVFSASALGLFVENRGQWSDSLVRYSYQSAGAAAAFTDSGTLFQLSGAPNQGSSGFQSVQVSASFVGASATRPVGEQQVEGLFNFYLGDASQHRSNVPGFEQVVYSELYSGVDMYTSGQRGQLKYEFHVAPGADYQQVQIRYSGIEGLSIAADGSLHIQTAGGEMVESAPVLYQEIAGRRREVAGRFVLLDGNTYGFEVTGEWDARYELVLDRELAWSTYLEEIYWAESGQSVAVDGEGNVLVTGRTFSAGWGSGGYDLNPNGESDAFVAKLSASGVRLWSTYLGGSGMDYSYDIDVDGSGDVLVAGATGSAGWVSGGYDTSYGGGGDPSYYGDFYGDAFVARLSSSGEHLWSTYLGGASHDWGCGIAVDGTGDVLVTGTTCSSGWTSGGYDTSLGCTEDAFVAKLSSSGQHLWSTYLGGDGAQELGYGIAADASGNVLVTGITCSAGWVSGGYDPSYSGEDDAFVAKLSSSGQHLWSTYLGGDDSDHGLAIAADASGNVLITGITGSAGWVSGGYDTSFGGTQDAFVVKLSSSGQHLWSTYLGADDIDYAYGVAVDESGNVFAAGCTGSAGWVSGGYDTSYGGGGDPPYYGDAFVAGLSSSGQHLWSTYLGGDDVDGAGGVAVDESGNMFATGTTWSAGWVSGGYETSRNGGSDAFVARILVHGVMLAPRSIAENQPVGTVVGSLSMGEADPEDTFSYALVAGPGDADNASFCIMGQQLLAAALFDYEARACYAVRIRATDQDGKVWERAFTIRITDVNEAPEDLVLQGSTVPENRPMGTVVGTLSASDPDAGESFTYTLVDGAGADDNSVFAIVGNQLRTAAVFDYDTKHSYAIRVRVTDSGGLWYETSLAITVTDVNQPPTDLQLSHSAVEECQPVGMAVGILSSSDPDGGESFSYSLVAGTGAEDNASFVVVGNELRTAGVFDEQVRNRYSVRIRSTDAGGLWVERSFTITILPVLPGASVVGVPQIIWTSLGHGSHDLTLHLVSHAAPLDLSSIDGDELVVSGPAGMVGVSVGNVTVAADGMSADVTYRLAAPGGRWDQADNGSYSLSVPAGSFSDMAGHVNRAKDLGGMGATLPGPLDVLVPGTPNADLLSVTLTNSEYVVQINGIGFAYDASLVRSIRIYGYGGNDRITINGESYICEVSGGTGNDTIQGGSGDDLIRGDEDSDVIVGNGGDDTLYGNFGNDSIAGGEGADAIMAGLGYDFLAGGAGNDSLYAGDQMDTVYGDAGDDYIEGRGKADTIYGGVGNDTILGGAGSDAIWAEDGDDRIWVGLHLAFADTVNGGAGNDVSDGDANDVLSNVESVLA